MLPFNNIDKCDILRRYLFLCRSSCGRFVVEFVNILLSVLHGSVSMTLLNADFFQGNVSTRFKWCGVFKCDFIANLPLSLNVILKIGWYLGKLQANVYTGWSNVTESGHDTIAILEV